MAGSTITITYDLTDDISNHVIYAKSNFEGNIFAQPGSAEIHVRDPEQTLSFTTGRKIQLAVDGVPLWAGYIMSVGRTYPLPVMDTVTVDPDEVHRTWILRCVDLNILFDKRVIYNRQSPTTGLETFDGTRYDGDLIRNDLVNLLDLADDNLDTTSEVDDIIPPVDPEVTGGVTVGLWVDPGSKWRAQMQDFANFSGAVWYIAPTFKLHYKALEDSVPSWGFSDVPNGTTTIGFRELDLQEDASQMVNDAFIWGGAGWAGGDEIVFSRETNAASISAHHRWQLAETHFGQANYKTQANVDARAEVIVNGAPGAVPGEPARGLQYPQFHAKLSWFSMDVPGGEHLVAGQIVTITLYVHGDPLVLTLPLRRVRMSFPSLDPDGDAYVRFDGDFSLQLSDPKTLWSFILNRQLQQASIAVATANASSPTAVYGAYYSDALIPNPDGSNTTFTLNPEGFSFIGGSAQVYKNGLLTIPNFDYTENPGAGEIEFAVPPAISDQLWIVCRLATVTRVIRTRSFTANAVIT